MADGRDNGLVDAVAMVTADTSVTDPGSQPKVDSKDGLHVKMRRKGRRGRSSGSLTMKGDKITSFTTERGITYSPNGITYSPNDHVYVENNRPNQPYFVCAIQDFSVTRRDTLVVKVKWYYRVSEVPDSVYQHLVQDRHGIDAIDSSEPVRERNVKSRELFCSEATDTYPVTALRGKCKVAHFTDVRAARKFQPGTDNFFCILGYNPETKRLATTQGVIRVGSMYQVHMPEYRPDVCPKDMPEQCEGWEEFRWQPQSVLDGDLMMYLRAARSVAAFAGMCDGGSTEDGCQAASMDDTTINAMHMLHHCDYNTGKSLQALVKAPALRTIDKKWNEEDTKRFVKGLRLYGKNFFRIRKECLPHRETAELVEYYYFWKKTPGAAPNRPHRRHRKHGVKRATTRSQRPASSEFLDLSSASECSDNESDDSDSLGGFRCQNCLITVAKEWNTGKPSPRLCTKCRIFFKKYGEDRPLDGDFPYFQPVKDGDVNGNHNMVTRQCRNSSTDSKEKKKDSTSISSLDNLDSPLSDSKKSLVPSSPSAVSTCSNSSTDREKKDTRSECGTPHKRHHIDSDIDDKFVKRKRGSHSDLDSVSDSGSISDSAENGNDGDIETNQDDLSSSSPPTTPSPLDSDYKTCNPDTVPPLVKSTIGYKLSELPRPEPQHPSPNRPAFESSPLRPVESSPLRPPLESSPLRQPELSPLHQQLDASPLRRTELSPLHKSFISSPLRQLESSPLRPPRASPLHQHSVEPPSVCLPAELPALRPTELPALRPAEESSPLRLAVESAPILPGQLQGIAPQGFVPLPPLPAFVFRPPGSYPEPLYPPLPDTIPGHPASEDRRSPSPANHPGSGFTAVKVKEEVLTPPASPLGIPLTFSPRSVPPPFSPRSIPRPLSPRPLSPRTVHVKQEPAESLNFTPESTHNVSIHNISINSHLEPPHEAFSSKESFELLSPKIEPVQSVVQSTDFNTSHPRIENPAPQPEVKVEGLLGQSEGEGETSEMEIMDDSESDREGTLTPGPVPTPCNKEAHRSKSAIFIRLLNRGERNSCCRCDLMFKPLPESRLSRRREERERKVLPPTVTPIKEERDKRKAASPPPNSTADAQVISNVPSPRPPRPQDRITPRSYHDTPALSRLSEYAKPHVLGQDPRAMAGYPMGGFSPFVDPIRMAAMYPPNSRERLELELERDKRERDARERELREHELRSMEMREKLKAELEMKPPGLERLLPPGANPLDPHWLEIQRRYGPQGAMFPGMAGNPGAMSHIPGIYPPTSLASDLMARERDRMERLGIPPTHPMMADSAYTAALMERFNAERMSVERMSAERLSAERLSAERLSAERMQAERMALSQDPMVRLQMAGLAGAVVGPPGVGPHTHTHAHAHTHLHLHQPDHDGGPPPPHGIHPFLSPHLLPPDSLHSDSMTSRMIYQIYTQRLTHEQYFYMQQVSNEYILRAKQENRAVDPTMAQLVYQFSRADPMNGASGQSPGGPGSSSHPSLGMGMPPPHALMASREQELMQNDLYRRAATDPVLAQQLQAHHEALQRMALERERFGSGHLPPPPH